MSLYLRPSTLEEAVHALAAQGGTILSGGTDFFPALGDRLPQGTVIDISALRDMNGVTRNGCEIRIACVDDPLGGNARGGSGAGAWRHRADG